MVPIAPSSPPLDLLLLLFHPMFWVSSSQAASTQSLSHKRKCYFSVPFWSGGSPTRGSLGMCERSLVQGMHAMQGRGIPGGQGFLSRKAEQS